MRCAAACCHCRATAASSLPVPLGPLPGVLEQAQPRARALGIQAQLGGVPGVLPHHEAALRVRHHRQVAAIRGAERSDTLRRAVGVEGVLRGGLALAVAVPAARGQGAQGMGRRGQSVQRHLQNGGSDCCSCARLCTAGPALSRPGQELVDAGHPGARQVQMNQMNTCREGKV